MAYIRNGILVIVFCIYMAAVFYLCFSNPDQAPQWPDMWLGLPVDKIGHFLMFLPFPLLGYMVLENDEINGWKRLLLLLGMITAGFAVAAGIEIAQSLLKYRSAETADLLADGVGLICGGLIAMTYILIRNRK